MQQRITNPHTIAILMAVFNGEAYLREQLDSLINQSCLDWTLYIRDDGSSDATRKILNEYLFKYPKLVLVDNNELHLGAMKSFLYLMEIVESEFYMFCDQDDVWLPEKIEITYKHMLEINESNKDKPIIIHTDLKLVDSNLNIISDSYWSSIKLDPDKFKSYNYLAICSYATGCTMMFNQKAKEVSLPVPEDESMHDWWVAINVIRKGIVSSIYLPTILYRQHDKNLRGVPIGRESSIFYRMFRPVTLISRNYTVAKKLKAKGYGSLLKYLFYKFLIFVKREMLYKR